MRRRNYLAGLGAGSTVLLAGAGSGTGTAPDRITPEAEVSFAPGTTVMFEVDGSDTEWRVDGADEGWSMGPWYAAYNHRFGRDYWQYTFESTGTYAVTAVDGSGGTTEWTVDVTPDGTEAPSVDAMRPDPGPIEATDGDSVDLEIDVAAAGGELDRVVWWLGQADQIVGAGDLSGNTATATATVDGGCHTCGVEVWTIDEHGAVDVARPWTFDTVGDADGRLDVGITDASDPVGAGQRLEVTATVDNPGPGWTSGLANLVVGDEVVDRQSVWLGNGDSRAITLGYDTYPVAQTVEFPVRVETGDDADERTVEVIGSDDGASSGPGQLDVTVTGTSDPVTGGERLEATATVTNAGTEAASGTVDLVVGGEVVDSRSVSLEANASRSLTLGYDTYPVASDVSFELTVRTDDDADCRTVTVHGTG